MKVLNYTGLQNLWTNIRNYITAHTPTKTSDLTNDSNFVDTSNPAVSSGITSAKVTDYDTHIADTDIHVTASDKTTWNTVTSKANDSDVVHKSGNETIDGVKSFINYFLGKDLSGQTVDLNDCVDAYGGAIHHYYAVSNYTNISNKPENKPFILESKTVRYVSSIDYIYYQKFYTADYNAPPSIYTRYYRSGSASWSNWIKDTDKFVTTDTNQTISGNKTFSSNVNIYNSDATANTPSLYLRSSKVEISSQGNISGDQNLTYLDKNNTTYAFVKGAIQSNGSAVKIRAIAKDSSDNSVVNELQMLAYTNGNKAIFPTYSNEVDLGASSYKWKSVFATNYYYGSNNVEFSTKFVTTDTAQTISGNKTFEGVDLKLKSVAGEYTVSSGSTSLLFYDKNSLLLSQYKQGVFGSGISYQNFSILGYDSNNQQLIKSITFSSSNLNLSTAFLKPDTDNAISLGRSNAKWSDVQTYKVNNLEPSSLSLPSDRSARIDISSYITNLGNGDTNAYTVPANGYIFLHFTSINGVLCYSQTSGGLTNYAQTFTRYQGDGQLYAFLPVRKNDYFVAQIYTSSTAVVQNAYFIPCQGNV